MRTIWKKGRIVLTSILIISILACLSIFSIFSNADKKTVSSVTKGNTDYSNIERDTTITVDSNGVLQISRKNRDKEISMGKENTWTIFLYLTGTNLESQYGNATNDIREILHAKFNSENANNINFIIQTGGCSTWYSNNIANDKIQRYKVNGNTKELELLESYPNSSMGSADTLYDFLDWGVSNYPAEHMGVIMWDHGSGVESGLCADPLYNNDSLTVHELEYAFAKVNKKMTSKFELIGFDTCLSGSLEYANLLAPYGKYMVASADSEPGAGWFYTGFIDEILKNPDISGADVGKVICNDYATYYHNPASYEQVDLTLAVYDLSKVDKVCVEANYLMKFLYDTLKNDINKYWTLTSMQKGRLRYNRNNMDLGSLLDYLESYNTFNYNTSFFRQALNELVIYSKCSEDYADRKAAGITIYYPDSIIYMDKLNSYRNVCFSPYWLKYIELITYRNITENISNFNETKWESSPYFFEKNFDFINYDSYDTEDNNGVYQKLNSNPDYSSSDFLGNWQSLYSISSAYQGGYIPPHLMRNVEVQNDNTELSATLTDKNLQNVYEVYTSIFTKINDSLVCLGSKNDVEYNQNTGKISSKFNGEWFMLPDGQLLTTYIVSTDTNSTVYAFPVMINDTEVTIRVKETKKSNDKYEYDTLGIWDSNGLDNQGARGYLPLKSGTTITPIYDVFDTDANEYTSEYGEEYTLKSDFDFLFGKLNDGEYSISYQLEKLNGIPSYTVPMDFSVEKECITIEK